METLKRFVFIILFAFTSSVFGHGASMGEMSAELLKLLARVDLDQMAVNGIIFIDTGDLDQLQENAFKVLSAETNFNLTVCTENLSGLTNTLSTIEQQVEGQLTGRNIIVASPYKFDYSVLRPLFAEHDIILHVVFLEGDKMDGTIRRYSPDKAMGARVVCGTEQ